MSENLLQLMNQWHLRQKIFWNGMMIILVLLWPVLHPFDHEVPIAVWMYKIRFWISLSNFFVALFLSFYLIKKENESFICDKIAYRVFFQVLYIIKHYFTRPKYVKNTSNITKIHRKTLFSLFLTISDHFKTKKIFFDFLGLRTRFQ